MQLRKLLVIILLLSSALTIALIPVVNATSASIISAVGNANGIDGTISIEGADASATIGFSSCTIFSFSASPENPPQVPSHGGLTNVIPLRSAANSVYKFSCYFDGPSQVGTYYASISVTLYPFSIEVVFVTTAMLTAGGGSGAPTTAATVSQNTVTAVSLTTFSSQNFHTATPSPQPSLQMPQPPQQTAIQSTNNKSQLALALAVIAAVALGALLLYSRRKEQPKVTIAEKVDTYVSSPSTVKATSGKRLCVECGNELSPNLMFCDSCGTKQPKLAPKKPETVTPRSDYHSLDDQ